MFWMMLKAQDTQHRGTHTNFPSGQPSIDSEHFEASRSVELGDNIQRTPIGASISIPGLRDSSEPEASSPAANSGYFLFGDWAEFREGVVNPMISGVDLRRDGGVRLFDN